ncbi:pyocin knob domain-containing protein, partial [Lactobacillus helveticus]
MSQYNKTVLTHAGLELAKRANAGQAKFGITRAVTSADDWSHKTVQDLEEVTTIPNIMQQGTIMDTDEVESSNSVIGVSLCFTNKNLSTGYQIRIIGLYVKEEGRENDFLYAVTTAITPEYMPSFADKVLYRFNTQMYLVIGNAQSVNVVINDGTAVTHGQLDKYKVEVAENLKKLENTHKEDMSHVAKSASINGGAEILPDSTGKLNLVVPDPDLSKYVSLEQLGELLKAKADVADVNKQIKAVTDLANTKANTVDVDSKIKTVTDLANTKANSADVYTKTETDNQINKFDLSKVKFRKQFLNGDGDKVDKTWSATKNDDGTYTIDLFNDDWTAAKLSDVIYQLPSKADKSNTYTKTDVDNKVNEAKSNAQSTANQIWGEVNSLKGKQTKDSADANALSETGVYYCSSPAKNFPVWHWGTLVTSNGNGERASQLYFPDDNSAVWFRTLDGDWRGWVRLANIDDVNNAESSLTSSINAVSNKVNEAKSNAQSTANQIWGEVNSLKGKQTKDSADANALSETG